MRENIILPHRIYKSMRRLSDAECGRLFRALLLYSMGEEQSIKLQGREEALYDVYTQEIDDDIAAYEKKCAQNKANASGGKRPQATASDGMRLDYNNNCNNNYKGNNNNNSNHHQEDDDAREDFNTIQVYAANNLTFMSPGNLEELTGFVEILPEDVIRFAIDEACANGAPRWAYVSAILRGYVKDGIKTVGDAKAAKDKRKTAAGAPQNPVTQSYQTRGYTDDDYGEDFYLDLTKGG